METTAKVRYHNKINDLDINKLTVLEQNVFFYLCSRAREHEKEEIKVSFDSIRTNTRFKRTGDKELIKIFKRLEKNLETLNYSNITDKKVNSIFSAFKINSDERNLVFSINENLLFLLNKLEKNFCEFDLNEFVDISSIYSKKIYCLCKQWRSVGKTPIYKTAEFRDLINLPESYENKLLIPRIITPAYNELDNYFHHFNITIHKGDSKGAPITGISFTFSPVMYARLNY